MMRLEQQYSQASGRPLVDSDAARVSTRARTRLPGSSVKGLVVFGAALAVGLVGLVVPAQAAPVAPSDAVTAESEHEYVLEGVDEFVELADVVAVDSPGAGDGLAQATGGYVLPVGLTATFVDVPVGATFFDEIEWLYERGITTGYLVGGERYFRPGNWVTRQAMAAFLYRLAGEIVTGAFVTPGAARFSDVPLGAPFFREIEWLASAGISVGYDDGTFRPRNYVHGEFTAAITHPDFRELMHSGD